MQRRTGWQMVKVSWRLAAKFALGRFHRSSYAKITEMSGKQVKRRRYLEGDIRGMLEAFLRGY